MRFPSPSMKWVICLPTEKIITAISATTARGVAVAIGEGIRDVLALVRDVHQSSMLRLRPVVDDDIVDRKRGRLNETQGPELVEGLAADDLAASGVRSIDPEVFRSVQ